VRETTTRETKDDQSRSRSVGCTSATGSPRKPLRDGSRHRSEKLLRDTVSMLCNFIWTRATRPGEHLWSIPVDKDRDFDCILSDAIDELVELRRLVDARFTSADEGKAIGSATETSSSTEIPLGRTGAA
jgi:hypothetical protein